MKMVYKCEIDGKVFDRERDCLKHEFELKGGSKHFENIVKDAISVIETCSDLKIELYEAKAEIDWDGDTNKDIQKYVEWQTIDLAVFRNGEKIGENYSRSSEGGFTKEVIIQDITDEYITPYKGKYEGYLTQNEDYYASGFDLDGVNLDKILRAMYGKKIRLEIIE